MLAWILEYAGYEPGYLIGGVPENFGVSARLGNSDFFVVEADEYDTAFFDKRSKFVHYKPRTLILNNLEFDHADIFENLAAIQRQFHHLLRTVARTGLVIYPANDVALQEVIDAGCWTECQTSSLDENTADWQARLSLSTDNYAQVCLQGRLQTELKWSLAGTHNVQNALHAIAAARHVGVTPDLAVEALMQFKGVKRRMELIGRHGDVAVYDDFAHHPTAIASTLEGLKRQACGRPVVAVIEPRSNTMKMGVHKATLGDSVAAADYVYWYQDSELSWSLSDSLKRAEGNGLKRAEGNSPELSECKRTRIHHSHEALIADVVTELPPGAQIVVMSNGGFAGMSRRLFDAVCENVAN